MPTMFADSLRAFLKPVAAYLDDPDVNEILVNGPGEIWIERSGRIRRVDGSFSEEGLMAAARNLAQYVGRTLSDERPRMDARLPDGSRIHIVLPPVARKGLIIAIRKFSKEKLTLARLVEFGSATTPMARLIESCVKLHQNIIVSGGTGSGKTTLLNVVSRFIADEERVVTIEDSAELQLDQADLISLEARPPDKFGKGEVTLGDLLHSALRLRPDRVVVGEVRGGEAFHLLQAMNTGHSGSLATTHANSPVDTLRRLETLCLMSGIELPITAVRAQVASAVHVVIICARYADGTRKISHVAEVLPLSERGDYRTRDLWVYTETGRDEKGRVLGYHAPTGILPSFLERLAAAGYGDMDERFFDPATWGLSPPPLFTADDVARTRWAPSLRAREAGGAAAPVRPAPAAPQAPAPAPVAAAAPAIAPEPPPAPAPSHPVAAPSAHTTPARTTPAPIPAVPAHAEPPAPHGAHVTPSRPMPAPLPAAPAEPPAPPASHVAPPTEDTPRSGVAAPFEAAAGPERREPAPEPEKPSEKPADRPPERAAEKPAEKPPAPPLPRAQPLRAEEKHERTPPPPARAPAPPPPPAPPAEEPTIQISEDLLEEVERAVVNESTHIQRNPLLRGQPRPGSRPAPAAPAKPARRATQREDPEERTDPHIRLPK